MGYDRATAEAALTATKNRGVFQAIDYVQSHPIELARALSLQSAKPAQSQAQSQSQLQPAAATATAAEQAKPSANGEQKAAAPAAAGSAAAASIDSFACSIAKRRSSAANASMLASASCRDSPLLAAVPLDCAGAASAAAAVFSLRSNATNALMFVCANLSASA